MFKPVSPKVDFPAQEEEILSYWKKNNIFEESVNFRPEDKTWTFLDGPPFVTGLPHYGHLLTSIAKDLFPRFWTMKGYRVRRVWGWDGHGLPIENKVETKLEIKSKKEIETTVGVKKFIEECKEYVNSISNEWEWYVDHVGRWVDFKNAYKTWDTPYMESVMWVFKQMYDKELVYKGLKVSLYCPHCATPVSNFEVAMDADNYKDIQDPATTYKYPLEGEENTYVLAWSTTPWNKIVTPALAVNPDLMYVMVEQNGEKYILAESTLKILKQETSYKIIDQFKGSNLVGKKFTPHYDYYKIAPGKKSFEIISGDFVTADEGTGVVTIASYGEEDLKAMQEQNVHIEMHLDEEGHVKDDVPQFGGMYYLKANKAVDENLESRGLIYETKSYLHSVAHCWRCSTRLYHAPINAWYVNVQKLKEEMKATNERVNWIPEHFRHGRFLKSLENAPDWNISRNRYWGSPVPVWECEKCDNVFVPGSISELEEASGQKISDLHKPEIDEVVVKCSSCGENMHRVSEVLDSWIEAGSASFGERHYPFENKEDFERSYPPDFIVEYTGQIRAWFYVVHVISNALYQTEGFRNVLVNGVILGTDGRKMSKNYGNYPDPAELLKKYGGDALRLYLMSSPVVQGEDAIISEEQYRQQVRGMMLVLWNTYNFFITYATIDGFDQKDQSEASENVLDKWILSLLNNLIKEITSDLENFDTISAISKLQKFVDDFSTWYIRRSRDRVGPTADNKADKLAFYSTTHHVLVMFCKVLAPFTPFLAESMYMNLTGEKSVHLTDWPAADADLFDGKIEEEMKYARQIVEMAHSHRKEAGIRVRQPLNSLTVLAPVHFSSGTESVIKDEVNIKNFNFEQGSEVKIKEFDTAITPDLKVEGEVRDLIRKIQEERKKIGTELTQKVTVELPEWPQKFEDEIKRKALVGELIKGDEFKVTALHE